MSSGLKYIQPPNFEKYRLSIDNLLKMDGEIVWARGEGIYDKYSGKCKIDVDNEFLTYIEGKYRGERWVFSSIKNGNCSVFLYSPDDVFVEISDESFAELFM